MWCLHSNEVRVSVLNVWLCPEKENLTPWQHIVIPPSNILTKSALLHLGIIIKKKRDINNLPSIFFPYPQTLLPPTYLLAKYLYLHRLLQYSSC